MAFMEKSLFSWFSSNIIVICKLEGAIILPTTKKIMHAKMCNNIVKPNPCFLFLCATRNVKQVVFAT